MAVSDLFRKLLSHVRPTPGATGAARYAYGKLPGAGDFLRAGARTASTTAFEAWLATALATADSLRGKAFREAYDRESLWLVQARFSGDGGGGGSGDGDGRILAGALRTSRDTVGRRHPLVLGALLPDSLHRAHPELVALAVAETQREALALLQRTPDCRTNKDLGALLDTLPLPNEHADEDAKRRWEQLLAREAAAFFAARFASTAKRDWALRTLREAVTPLDVGTNKKPAAARVSALLALPAGGPSDEIVAVVTRLTRAWGAEPADPVLVLSPAASNGEDAAFFACGHEPPATMLVDVLRAGAYTDTLCDLRGAVLSTNGYRTELPAAFATATSAETATLGTVLAALEGLPVGASRTARAEPIPPHRRAPWASRPTQFDCLPSAPASD